MTLLKKIVFAKIVLALALLIPGLASTAQKIDPKLIIGRWRGADDKKSELVFTNDKQIDYYGGKQVAVNTYLIRHDSLMTIDVKYGDTLYYDIDKVNKQTLSLLYLGRGNMLLYRRVQE